MTRTVARVLDGTLVLATATADTPEGPFTAGACGLSEHDAAVRAGSELVERTTLLTQGPLLVEPAARARAAGGRMLPIFEAPAAATGWVPAEPVNGGEAVWLPADLVLLRWHDARESPVQQTSVGSAAHPDRARAIDAGVRECLERYAVRRVWSGATELTPLTKELDEAVPDELPAALRRHGLTASAWLVNAVLPIAVVLVMVGSDRHRATFGASCAATVEDGLRHALCEAVSVRAAFAAPRKLRDNFTVPDEVDHALRASAFQDAFAAFLRRMTTPGDVGARPQIDSGVVGHLERELRVTPMVIDLGRRDDLHVVKVVVPAPEFFVPRRQRGYVLNPGYLE